MKNLKTFENFVNEELHRSQDDPSASIGSLKPTKWEDVELTPKEIKFLIFIYNNFDSGGPMASEENWNYIVFDHAKNMMKKVIEGKYKNLKQELVTPIAEEILKKLEG